MSSTYNQIGRGYAVTRNSDPLVAQQINRALGDARSVLNVGSGPGSYEPADRTVVAVEPATLMLAQRPGGAAPAVLARAEALPFADRSFDATMSVLSTHHWADLKQGVAELRRVARQRVVVFTYDVACIDDLWVCDYFPSIAELDHGRIVPLDQIAEWLGGGSVIPVPIPADCTDGFLAAFWRRPEAYLDAGVRAGISSFAVMPTETLERGLMRLSEDLAGGAWTTQYGRLLALDELDCGYRLLVSEVDASG